MSDFQCYESKVAKNYGLSYLPMNFLSYYIDKTVATQLMGEALKNKQDKHIQ